jgi:type 2 lantibiotic biosynthesis protein LanM
MALAADELRAVVTRSSTVPERVNSPFTTAAGETPQLAGRALGAFAGADERVPSWITILERLDARAISAASETGEPFEEALAPFLVLAREALRARVPALVADALTRHAWAALELALLRQLARIAGRTLFAEFSAHRVATEASGRDDDGGRRAFSRAIAAAAGISSRGAYDTFLAHLGAGGLERVLIAYPVLARLLAMRVADWIESSAEFLQRVTADAPLFEQTFNVGRLPGEIVELACDLSDPHRGGRTVCRVSFASGLRVIYKPRNLRLEAAFSALLRWVNDGRVSLPLKAPVVLDRGGYGWMECISAEPCAHADAIERYHVRAGMLLCLAYVLGGSDLHQGNMIASGEHPVLIDLEAFMQASPRRSTSASGMLHELDRQPVWDSLLRTGMLPVNRVGLRGSPHRNGGLVAIDPGYGRHVPRWEWINTDLMTFTMGPPIVHRANLPHLGNESIRAEDHVDAIGSGFIEMTEALRRSRVELLGPDSVLRAFRGARTRIVLRDTGVYATLLDRALHPRLLREGAEWSVEFELLNATTTNAESTQDSINIGLAERHALARLDVPLFEAASDTTGLDADGREIVADYLAEPGYTGTLTRIAELDAARTGVHLQCIRLALRPASHRRHDDVLSEALAIGRTLRAIADDSADQQVEWLGIRGLTGSAPRDLYRVGWDLYGGRCGIALFFAALERCGSWTGEPSFVTRILAPLVESLNDEAWVGRAPDTLGALGSGGLVYGLTLTATLLKSESLLDAATRAAECIGPETIAHDTRFDIVAGAAGATLGLLVLFDERPLPWILDRAERCGRHLLDRVTEEGGVSGFAHGSAGIACALARLYQLTGLRTFRDAALASLPMFDDTSHGGPCGDGSEGASARAAAMRRSWCQGSAGIGLARLDIAASLDRPDLRGSRSELDLVLDDAGPSGALSRSDHLCCGNAGRLELLSRAADVLGEPRWRNAAHAVATQMIQRARVRGGYTLGGIDDVFSPGLYQGLAGIGYQLLRLHDRELPSVLSWR